MAHITIRKLKDEESQKWMESQGFINIESASDKYSSWMCHNISLNIPIDTLIRNLFMFLLFARGSAFKEGTIHGKKEAIEEISNHLHNVLFPPPLGYNVDKEIY